MHGMTFLQWKAVIKDLIDKAQREPGFPIPATTVATLKKLREQLETPRNSQQRKKFEQKLEAFIESDEQLRAAIESRLYKEVPLAIAKANATLTRADRYLKSTGRKKLPGRRK
jgi:hypothetical protein